jgi:acyl-CoA reductase-like NAD-dependent aldehyde dehydrogenase
VSTLATLAVTSPYSGALVGEAPMTSPAQVAEALDDAARAGAPPPRHERARVLSAVAD